MNLSVIIPVYNEAHNINEIIKRVQDTKLATEIVIVDDGSTDGTREVLQKTDGKKKVRVILHEKNQGKGAAVVTGMKAAQGDILLIQDADLEYDPRDYPTLLKPIQEGVADVVYGSRFLGRHRVFLFTHYLGNRVLTLITNILYNTMLSDMETCYKVMRADVARSLKLRSETFTIEPEITAKVAKGKWRIYEVGISYAGRDYAEGKKIGPLDGLKALWAIVRFRLFD